MKISGKFYNFPHVEIYLVHDLKFKKKPHTQKNCFTLTPLKKEQKRVLHSYPLS